MINEYIKKIKDKGLKEVINEYIARIEKSDINTFIYFSKEDIERQIKILLHRKENGEEMPLFGVPIGIKDNIAVKDMPLTCASQMLENYISPYDAEVIEKLKEKGAIIMGKQNLDEFAMGSSTESSFFGPTLNPYDKDRVPGGSSGGSTASVANEEVLVALGTDTGGSIRQPAAFCGVVGFSPAYGTVSRYGLVSFTSSLDRIGPIAKKVKDAFILYNTISFKSTKDMTCFGGNKINVDVRNDKKFNIAKPKEFYGDILDDEVKEKVEKVWEYLLRNDNIETNVSLPLAKYSVSVYQAITMSEVSSNLSRYDGIKYGLKAESANSLNDIYYLTRGKGFGDEVKRRVLAGTYILSSKEFEGVYEKSLSLREQMKKDIMIVFENTDIVMVPTTTGLPFKFGARTKDPLKMHFSDSLTAYANLAGIHSISVPIGFVDGLPVGIQLFAPLGREQILYEMALRIEEGVENGEI